MSARESPKLIMDLKHAKPCLLLRDNTRITIKMHVKLVLFLSDAMAEFNDILFKTIYLDFWELGLRMYYIYIGWFVNGYYIV